MVRLDPVNAQLLLQIYDMRREERLRKAREWFMPNFWAENLKDFGALCPVGSDANAYYRMLTSYWEMVASIVNRGMLDEDLYFENNGEGLFVWLRVKNVVQQMREARKNPLILKNLETLAEKHEKWINTRAPEALQQALKTMAGMRKNS